MTLACRGAFPCQDSGDGHRAEVDGPRGVIAVAEKETPGPSGAL